MPRSLTRLLQPARATKTQSSCSIHGRDRLVQLPDGTSVTDTTAPFDTTKVADASGMVFKATPIDNQGATATTTVTVTVANGQALMPEQAVRRDGRR